ncbi:MAG: hypothetical protein WCH11_02340, partial [Bdellovibrio sp.]
YITIGSPEAQRLFALKSEFLSTGHIVYWGVILITFVLGRILISTHFSRLALVFAVGLLFDALIFVTDPSPGWILWGLPFICLLHSIYTRTPPVLIIALIGAYFAHEIAGLHLALSLQQTLILSYGILFEVLILHKQAPFLNRRKPLLIGISGDSGAGKDILAQNLCEVLGSRSVQVIAGDNYHRWERGHANWKRYTHLHPSGNSLRQLHHNLMDLREGRHIWSQFYDHDSGRFTPLLRLTPARNVIVQGLHTLFHPDIRRQFDLQIHLAPQESLRREWKLQRDTKERGHSKEKVQLSLHEREKDSANFIQTQAPYAHWIISFKPGLHGGPPLLSCNVPNEPLMMDLAEALGMRLSWSQDLNRLQIEQTEKELWSQGQIQKVAEAFFVSLRSVTRGREEPRLKAGTDGALQLLFLAFLERERQFSSLYFDPSPQDPRD